MTTLFISPQACDSDGVTIEGSEYHHLVRVCRLGVGETLRLADGAGRARHGTLESIDKSSARVVLGAEMPANEPELRVELLVVGPRKPRAEWLVEKSCELGVCALRFLNSERGPRTYGAGAFERFARIARSAAEQSERSVVPEVSGMHSWDEVDALAADSGARVVLDASGSRLGLPVNSRSATLLIGPEGGLTDGERAEVVGLGFVPASLGPRPLRVETAAVAALASCVLAH